jgi:hypothetical protein
MQMSNQSTNVTITWQESPNFSNTSNWFNWGNTTNYGFTSNPSYNGVTYTVFLDFLEPQTVYHFQIEIEPSYHSCTTEYVSSSNYGTFTTLPEAVYVGQYGAVIMGVVYNANGQRAPMGLEVYVQCTGYNLWSQYTFTNAQGAYSMTPALGQTGCPQYGKGYYIVELLNTGTIKAQWPGYWNESVVIWAVQCVNFYLPLNHLSAYFPEVLDFSNAAAGYSTISYSAGTSTSYTTGLAYSWSAGVGGLGASGTSDSSTTYNVGSSGGFQQQGGTLDYIVQMETSGTVAFNAINRTWSMSNLQLVGGMLNGEPAAQDPQFVQPSDWLTPMAMNQSSNTPTPFFVYNGGASKYLEDVPAKTPGFDYTGGVTTSTTLSVSGGYSISFSLSFSLAGVVPVNVGVSGQWSQSSSTTYTQELTYSIGMPPTGGSPFCFDVIGQGGGGTTADMFGIYTWSLNAQGGCTTP